MVHIDFSRSFIQFTTANVDHTPRLQVDAVCRLSRPGGEEETVALAAACICEQMYVDKDLVHRPPAEFLFMAKSGEEFLILKMGAHGDRTVREAHRVGETMTTHDGRGGRMKAVDVYLAEAADATRLEAYDEVREAILRNRTIHARTSFEEPDGTRVELLYPVKVCNVAHDRPLWQVDTGRILFPARPRGAGLAVERFEPAYIVYHDATWAELAILRREPAGPGGLDYSDIRRLDVRNELYQRP